MTDIIDQPQPGYYAVRRGGRDVSAVILSDGGMGLIGYMDGQEVAIDDIWVSNRRKVTEKEYREIASRPAPLPAVTEDNAAVVAQQMLKHLPNWKAYTIDCDEGAAKAKDFADRMSKAEKTLDGIRKREKQPHLDAGKEVDAKFSPTITALDAGKRMVMDKLTAWMRAEKARKAQEEMERAAATVEGSGQVLAPVSAPEPVKVRGNMPGRAASVRARRHATLQNWDAAVADSMFRDHPDVVAALTKVANEWVRKGAKVIPGFEITEEEVASL